MRVLLEQQRQRLDRTVQEVAAAGRQNRAALAGGVPSSCRGCHAFTRELRRVVWPMKFKPDLPARYDGTPNPAEFLQLYALSIVAANDDDKVMVNWFPMALKDGPRSWLMNLPEASISPWAEPCRQFVANFKGTHERSLMLNDLRAVC